jgi:hypothetical protein
MRQLDAHADIDAPAENVWAVLTDLAAYPVWNPFIVRATGELREGQRLRITLQVPNMRPVSFRPTLLVVQPGREIRWLGVTFVRGLFDGRHALTVEPLADGRSRFRTHEDVSGVLLPFLGGVMRRTQQGFEGLAQAVKERTESLGPDS